MNRSRELSFEECKRLQLEILNEVDNVCREHSISYSLAFGTLLGAIRHKGYIPWDDDLDIMMPYEEMCKLRNILNSSDISFFDIDTDKSYGNPFGNICSNRTFRKIGRKIERGLGIDVYPIVKIPNNLEEQVVFFNKAAILQSKRKIAISARMFLLKRFSFSPNLGYYRTIKNYRDFLVSHNNSSSNLYYIIAGPLEMREKMIYDKNIFDELIVAEFEGKTYPIIKEYDYFLNLRYGNYMQLPPENQRHPYHGQHYYWK